MALITSAATLVIVVVVSPLFLHAQALVEYGALGAKTSAATPLAAAGINRATQRVGSSVAHQGLPERTRSTSSAIAVQKAGRGIAATALPASPHDAVEIQGAAVPKDQRKQPQSRYRNSVTVSF